MWIAVQGFPPGVPTVSAITCKWNPADTGSSLAGTMSFTNSDLDASEVYFSFTGVRATTSRQTGKYYVEFDAINVSDSGADIYICMSTTAANLNDGGTSGTPLRWRGNGQILNQTNGTPNFYNIPQGSTAQMAVDLDNAKVWLAITTNAWIGGGSPSAGTTETVLYTSLVGNVMYPAYQTDNITTTLQKIRILGHAANQHNAAPSGFTPWGD